MKNLFDSANYPDTEPEEVVAGSRWNWTRSDITAVYPTALYTLRYNFANLAEPNAQFEITADKVASAHVVEHDKTETALFGPGEYEWRAYIVRDSDSAEVHVESGFITVLPSLEEHDDANWTYQVLQAVRATIKGRATDDQLEVEIAGRRLRRHTLAELRTLEQEFGRRWQAIKDDRARKAGKTVKSRVLVTMSA